MFDDEYNNGDYDCHNNDNSSPNQNENKPVVFIYKKIHQLYERKIISFIIKK